MKKVLLTMFSVMGLAFSLTGCTNEEAEPQFLDVEVSVNPEKGEINEPIVIKARVTYGDEEVTDAEDVKFEIWRAHDEEHEKLEVPHNENGVYQLEKTFEEEGTYYVISHVTARDMHNMPKVEFVVGEPSEPETSPESEMEDMEQPEGSDSEEHNSH
ncbi:FixH family protein [Mesobacillus harenae]|uniref:FixH family protein n=1 Tax=Mesobacillus harenae TaxID=2213203 RepID=UPI001580C1BA|nr:FixH family protein [Mesobacillus harenae]